MAEKGKEITFQIPPAFYLYKDGSVRRGDLRPPLPPLRPEDGVVSKDVTLNAQLGLWARIYLPNNPSNKKLPLVLFFHGGAFILGSPALSHPFCAELSKRSGAIWVSASYRLAPEHRLPAAYDDGFAALQWLHSQALLQSHGKEQQMEAWLANADFTKCFVAGESAGGNLAHRVAVRAMAASDALAPMCIRGLIAIHPGFARQKRTKEEESSPEDVQLNWGIVDKSFEMALPQGANREHAFANPLAELAAGGVNQVPRKVLVALAEKDRLQYMGQEYAQALKKGGCSVEVLMSPALGHCFYTLQPKSEQAELLYGHIAKFISAEDCCLVQKFAKSMCSSSR